MFGVHYSGWYITNNEGKKCIETETNMKTKVSTYLPNINSSLNNFRK